MKVLKIILAVVIIGISGKAFPQNSFPKLELINAQYDSLKSDTVSPPKKKQPKSFKMKKNPWVAVGLSALVPGAGQLYNTSYWKIPIILGVGGYLGYEIYRYNDKYNQYEDLYVQSQASDPNGNSTYKEQRDDFKDKRDEFIIYFALFYVINMVDAYVDAHLYDFDVSEDIKVQMLKGSKLLNVNFNF
ncbi:MAG: hypothetical protein KDC73_08465 [Ignavibacteriae bacterium]|nr:hypothetical protein [Ignavibacteriota bacterium]MCB9242260.1 hypothetical protein [Ignavibacteriales bacterium]